MIVNNTIYDIDLSKNQFAAKVKKISPMTISIIPYIENSNGDTFPITHMKEIIEQHGVDFLLENYEPSFGFSLFKEKDFKKIKQVFLDDRRLYFNEFATPSFQSLFQIIGRENYLEDVLSTNAYDEIEDMEDAEEYIKYIQDCIDNVFEDLNNDINLVDKWFETRYEIIGSLMQTDYVFTHIKTPNLVLDFDGKNCGIFRTKLATTYFLPNGI